MLSGWIAQHFGSKRGMLYFFYYQLCYRLGAYRFEHYHGVKRLIFVCSGNICRSPYAQMVAQSLGMPSLSFGLDCQGGAKAHHRVSALSGSLQHAMRAHRSNNLQHYKAQDGDLVLVMEPKQLLQIKQRLPQSKVALLGLWARSHKAYLHDPYGCNTQYFSRCLSSIHDAVTRLVKEQTHVAFK